MDERRCKDAEVEDWGLPGVAPDSAEALGLVGLEEPGWRDCKPRGVSSTTRK